MKKILLFAAVLTGLSAQGQYWQNYYSTADYDVVTSGENTNFIGTGHLSSGYVKGINTAFANLLVLKTDVDGNIATLNDFANEYEIYDPVTGNAMFVPYSRAFEINTGNSFNGSNYVVVGSCFYNNRYYAFYLELDNTGAIIAGSELLLYAGASVNTPDHLFALGACLSAAGTDVYITGNASTGGTDRYGWVGKINFSAAPSLTMSNIFSVPNAGTTPEYTEGRDLVESPFTANELLIVGNSYNGSNMDGFMQVVDNGTGAVIGNASLHGTAASDDRFESIIACNNPSFGFAVGGYSNVNTTNGSDTWITFLSNTNAFVSDNLLNNISGDRHDAFDLKERQNTLLDWEYYLVGTYMNTTGTPDPQMMVIKYNSNTTLVNTFLYGGTSREIGRAIDYYEIAGAPYNGLSIFGLTDNSFSTTSSDFYTVKSYFNGESGCNQSLVGGSQLSGPGQLTTSSSFDVTTINTTTISASQINTFSSTNLCYNLSIGTGSNAMNGKLPVQQAADQLNTSGVQLQIENPASAQQPVALTITSSAAYETVAVRIYDLQGRSFEAGSFLLTQGTNEVKLNLNELQLNNGIYLLEVSGAAQKTTTLLYLH